MTSINDSLSQDLLFNIFKRLDFIETTRTRRVCKQWFEIIDEHKSFWRILHLPKDSLKKWDLSILELFDRKSGSSLREINIKIPKVCNFEEDLFETLKRSRKSLKRLFVEHRGKWGDIRPNYLGTFTDLEVLMVLDPYWLLISKVRVNRKASASLIEGLQDASSSLKVLWYDRLGDTFETNPLRFRNLVSLDINHRFSSSGWRNFLDGPSRTLKHLRMNFSYWGEQENWEEEERLVIPSLDFPLLEVLELAKGHDLPRWITFPTSVTFIDRGRGYDTALPSISKLWTSDLDRIHDVHNRAPILQTLRVFLIQLGVAHWKKILEIVTKRWKNVQAKLEVDGVQIEMIKTLIVPFSLETSELSNEAFDILERLKELVENVIDGDSVPEFIDIEI